MAFFFQGLRRTTCAARFNNYILKGPIIKRRGRPEKTYSLSAGGQEKLQGPIGCRAVDIAFLKVWNSHDVI